MIRRSRAGQVALPRVVRDGNASEDDRAQARDALTRLRRPAPRPALSNRPRENTRCCTAVRELPYSWAVGFQRPAGLRESADNLARARAILQARAPSGPVLDRTGDEEEPPPWLEIRATEPYRCSVGTTPYAAAALPARSVTPSPRPPAPPPPTPTPP